MSNRIRKAKYDNMVKLNRSLLSEENLNINNEPDVEQYIGLEEENHDHGGTPPYAKEDQGKKQQVNTGGDKKLNEGCGCGGSKGTSEDNTHGDWIEDNLTKIDQMMGNVAGDIGSGGCPPGQHWCNATGDCHDDHSPQTEPLSITGMEVINLQERIGRRIEN